MSCARYQLLFKQKCIVIASFEIGYKLSWATYLMTSEMSFVFLVPLILCLFPLGVIYSIVKDNRMFFLPFLTLNVSLLFKGNIYCAKIRS